MFCFIHVDFLSKTLYLYCASQYFGDQVCLVVTLKGRILIIHCSYPLLSVKSVIITSNSSFSIWLVQENLMCITNIFQQLSSNKILETFFLLNPAVTNQQKKNASPSPSSHID